MSNSEEVRDKQATVRLSRTAMETLDVIQRAFGIDRSQAIDTLVRAVGVKYQSAFMRIYTEPEELYNIIAE